MYDILIIDDNHDILEMNLSFFSESGHRAHGADTAVKAIALLNEKQFDCIVLDVLLPDIHGFTVCQAVRGITKTPIIFLTCMDNVEDKIKGLAAGGDDYLTKPYSLDELYARVMALIRRGKEQAAARRSAEFFIDHPNRMIHAGKENVFLSKKEYELFMLLYQSPGTTFSRTAILAEVWPGEPVDESTVAVHIMRLRRKIEFAADYVGEITNSYRKGYRLKAPKGERRA